MFSIVLHSLNQSSSKQPIRFFEELPTQNNMMKIIASFESFLFFQLVQEQEFNQVSFKYDQLRHIFRLKVGGGTEKKRSDGRQKTFSLATNLERELGDRLENSKGYVFEYLNGRGSDEINGIVDGWILRLRLALNELDRNPEFDMYRVQFHEVYVRLFSFFLQNYGVKISVEVKSLGEKFVSSEGKSILKAPRNLSPAICKDIVDYKLPNGTGLFEEAEDTKDVLVRKWRRFLYYQFSDLSNDPIIITSNVQVAYYIISAFANAANVTYSELEKLKILKMRNRFFKANSLSKSMSTKRIDPSTHLEIMQMFERNQVE